SQKKTRFEEAIACSYYRCVEGCAYQKIKNLLDGDCREKYCNSQWTDNKKPDGKICGTFRTMNAQPLRVVPVTSYV
ncbi:MAG: hypothetical protein QMD12_02700, partial [Candidatus Aenigmarchaeota archaeon]|nr:hypothetical protein [Candidatus Aenigmarchaeota archaeon]